MRADSPSRGWVRVHPAHRQALDQIGLRGATAFLELPGPVVSGHPDRHVRRVEVGGRVAYLKVEHRVPWRDRLRHAWIGSGFASKSQREADMLEALAASGLSAPDWLACGEDGHGRAFLLVAEVAEAVDLRRQLAAGRDRLALARRLGVALARLHAAGFDHPDLHAKHVLVRPGPATVLLDWQNARRFRSLGWRRRVRALAWLDATLAKELAPERERLVCLHAYLTSRRSPRSQGAAARCAKSFALAIRKRSAQLQRRRVVQEARRPPLAAAEQQLLWLDGEAICAVPAVAEELSCPQWRFQLYTDADPRPQPVTLADGRPAWLKRRRRWAPGRLVAWLRRKAWRSPELWQSGLLFHLQRQGVSCARLLAFGQRFGPFEPARSFLLTEALPGAVPLADRVVQMPERSDILMSAAEGLLRQLHDARCHFVRPEELAEGIWVRDGASGPELAVGRVNGLRLSRRPLRKGQIERDRWALARLFEEAGR